MSKEIKEYKTIEKREFLNETTHRTTTIASRSTTNSTEDVVDFALKITDCSNSLEWDFSCKDDEYNNFENSIHKIDVFISHLTELKEVMMHNRQIWEEKQQNKIWVEKSLDTLNSYFLKHQKT
jgi:thymidylate synthase